MHAQTIANRITLYLARHPEVASRKINTEKVREKWGTQLAREAERDRRKRARIVAKARARKAATR